MAAMGQFTNADLGLTSVQGRLLFARCAWETDDMPTMAVMESPPAVAAAKRPFRKRVTQPAPEGLKVKALAPGAVALSWKPGPGRKPSRYLVLRDGRRLVQTRKPAYTDRSVAPGASYRYAVEALDAKGRASRPSKSRRVRVPAGATSLPPALPPAPGGSTNPQPAPAPAPAAPPGPPPSAIGTPLSTPMVDRLFWRAGFGPSDADRQAWTGRDVGELVDFFLSTPNTLRATSTPPLTQGNGAIDPLVSDDELVMDWIDRMQRSTNPFVERLTFFWHRHWAVTRDDGTPARFLLTYADRLRSYADLGANPSATFRDLAYDMTTKDGAMSLFLNGTQNTKTRPNESYAREFMELFCLGVVDAQGNPSYAQTDVSELAKAFTGWRVDQTPTSPTYGQVSFQSSSFDSGSKTILGKTASFTATQAVDQVLAHPAHAPNLVRKLWGEFIATPPDQATVDALASVYTGSGLQLKPLLRRILTHPLVFESLDEPNLVKPPVLYTRRAASARRRNEVVLDPRGTGQHAAAPLPPAQRRGLGGRPVLAQHEYRAGPLRPARPCPLPQALDEQLRLSGQRPASRRARRDGAAELRPSLRGSGVAVALGLGAPEDPRLCRCGARLDGHAARTATVRAARPRPRPRRPGDVMERSAPRPGRADEVTERAARRPGPADEALERDARRPGPADEASGPAPNASSRCISCEELELARVRDQAPSQTLPIPNAALAGFPEGRASSALTRRRLLQYGLAGFAAVYASKALGFESVWEAAVAEGAVAPSNQLVVLYLAGGNDELNTLVPASSADYAAYQSARPVLSRGLGATAGGRVGSQPLPGVANGQLNLANVLVSSSGGGDNGSSQFGLDKLYGDGTGGAGNKLALLPAVDFLPANLSHFESADHWFAGTTSGLTTGWLGRWLDRNGSQANPLQAISIDTARLV